MQIYNCYCLFTDTMYLKGMFKCKKIYYNGCRFMHWECVLHPVQLSTWDGHFKLGYSVDCLTNSWQFRCIKYNDRISEDFCTYMDNASRQPTELAWQIPIAVYTVLRYSWWWTVDLSETCRVLYEINLRNYASHWLLL